MKFPQNVGLENWVYDFHNSHQLTKLNNPVILYRCWNKGVIFLELPVPQSGGMWILYIPGLP